jgi:hypothetical protein
MHHEGPNLRKEIAKELLSCDISDVIPKDTEMGAKTLARQI